MVEKNNKRLVIYYSLEGNTKLIAKVMAEEIGADLLQLNPKKEIKSKSFSKYFWGGSQVLMKKQPELMPFEVDPMDYDFIIIGTPVWAWTYAPPISTLLSKVDFSGKTVGLFSCNGGQNGKTFINMKKHLKNSHIVSHIEFIEPLTKDKKVAIERAQQWIREMVSKTKI
ncbi:flavodoxin [Natranaerovirga hydrolytica]|uniref:Flavodoxin n=1 Tax=Natranaerovirga hydrolytica TaxID=680378 RepID=A0A4R1MYY6_9FIRM|nr:flavodoxin [Natranaerovirga hydrolytica]TCK98527.1 flavodoxin [Natranaerovirga hydrolytica]